MPSKFSVLPPEYLASQPPLSEMTLQNLIDTQDRLAEEAREILPYSFDECTYARGYLRQAVWSCLDCGEKGVCYGCSISCHSDHRLVELWTKRAFRCDCPTCSMVSSLPSSSKRRCNLNPSETQPQPPNDKNRYSNNFAGKFCRCGRTYDPETEAEGMINCISCEDWFHESCLNLQCAVTVETPVNETPQNQVLRVEDDDDDYDEDEVNILIPSDSYDSLICSACVHKHPFLLKQAGSQGWMIIEPGEKNGDWKVVGKKVEEIVSVGSKRTHDDDLKQETKRPRVDTPSHSEDTPLSTSEATISAPLKGKGDIFLAYGVRDKLKFELSAVDIASLPFPLEDEEIYEPPKDEEEQETLEEVTDRVISTLPRFQAIEALHGYQAMKDKLKVMLTAHVQSGETVSREDIEIFFNDLRSGSSRRG